MTHSSFIGIASVFRSFKVLMIGPTTALHCLFRSPVVDDFKLVSRDETQESDQLKCNQLHVVQALGTSKFQTACCWHLNRASATYQSMPFLQMGSTLGLAIDRAYYSAFLAHRLVTLRAFVGFWSQLFRPQVSHTMIPDHIMSIESERSFLNELENLVLYLSTGDQKSVVDS